MSELDSAFTPSRTTATWCGAPNTLQMVSTLSRRETTARYMFTTVRFEPLSRFDRKSY